MSQISESVRARVRASALTRCGYCCSQQKYVLGILEIEYIIPKAVRVCDHEKNLWLACRLCNSYKGIQTHAKDTTTSRNVKSFNPRQQKWSRHFTWSDIAVVMHLRTKPEPERVLRLGLLLVDCTMRVVCHANMARIKVEIDRFF